MCLCYDFCKLLDTLWLIFSDRDDCIFFVMVSRGHWKTHRLFAKSWKRSPQCCDLALLLLIQDPIQISFKAELGQCVLILQINNLKSIIRKILCTFSSLAHNFVKFMWWSVLLALYSYYFLEILHTVLEFPAMLSL